MAPCILQQPEDSEAEGETATLNRRNRLLADSVLPARSLPWAGVMPPMAVGDLGSVDSSHQVSCLTTLDTLSPYHRVSINQLIGYVIALIALVITPVAAEVRLLVESGDSPILEVHAVRGGTWTARDPMRAGTINPNGDLTGDSMPSHAVSRGSMLVAWHRATDESLVVLHADGGLVQSVETVPAGRPLIGRPLVTLVGDLWLIASQSTEPRMAVLLRAATRSATGDEVEVASGGQLIDVLCVESSAFVLVYAALPQQLDIVHVTAIAEPQPFPLPGLPLDLVAPSPFPDPAPISTLVVEVSLLLSSANSARDGHMLAAWSPCIEQTDNGYLLAWKTGDGFIGSVTLTAGGVGEPVFVRGPNGSCQATLNAAPRE